MKSLLLSFIIIFSFPFYAWSQTADEALRLTDHTVGGTARGLALGGAYGAVGADFSSSSINPAGLGLYRSSEFMFSPAYDIRQNKVRYLGNTVNENDNKFQIENFGVLFSKEDKESKWRYTNIGFSYITLNKYHNQYTLSALNEDNSLMDYYANQANGTSGTDWLSLDPLGIGLLYEGYILNPDVDNIYTSAAGPGLVQTETISTSGSHREFNISGAANYNDKLYLGASIGFPNYDYQIIDEIIEDDEDDRYDRFESYNYTFQENTEGNASNIKLGIIYRLINPLRIGLSLQTRSSYSIETTYGTTLESNLEGIDQIYSGPYESELGFFNYNFRTAAIYTGSVAYIFKKGLISVDYQYTDPSAARYSVSSEGTADDEVILEEINQEIKSRYSTSSKLRIGAELANEQLRYRLGAGLENSPEYSSSLDYKMTYSGGIGYRFKSAAIDLAYAYNSAGSSYSFYSGTEPADKELIQHTILSSLSFRF